MIYEYLKKNMPAISATERAAIEAGDTWIEDGILQGNIDWDEWLEPGRCFTDEEQEFMNGPLNKLCGMLNDYEINKAGDLPTEVWNFILSNRFFSMIIPKTYGGLEFSPSANAHIVATLGTVSPTAAITVMVPNSLGPGELLHKYGTTEQRDKWLPGLADGTEIPCFGLTSVHAGSDAGAIRDTGVIFEEGGRKKLRLNFSKRYITLAPVATVIGVAFKALDEDGNELGITCALIPTDTPGVDTSNRHEPMGMAFMNGPVFGKDVVVDLEDAVIGGSDMVGEGWRMLVECLSAGRGISLPSSASASTQACLQATYCYTKTREQFNTELIKFEGIREPLANIAMNTYAINSMRETTLHALDSGLAPSVITAMIKYHSTELARDSVNHAFDIHGGKAIMQGPKNYLSKFYQGAPVAITVEGANILTRNLMIFGQGSIRCHPFLVQEIDAINKADGKEEFMELFKSHAKYVIGNSLRSFGKGITFNLLADRPFSGLHRRNKLTAEIDRLSLALSVCTDFSLLTLGGKLKRKEYISARLGDVFSQLFIAASCVRSMDESNYRYAEVTVKRCLYLAGVAFEEFFANFPNRLVAFKMRAITFPTGIRCPAPTFKELDTVVSDLDRVFYCDFVANELTPNVYIDDNKSSLIRASTRSDVSSTNDVLNVDHVPA